MRRFTNRLKVPWFVPRRTNTSPGRNDAATESGANLNSNGLLSLKNLPQPQWTRFEDANAWEPEEHVVMYCMNGQDNVPARMKLENEFVYYISQSRSPGHKDQGQDCMATARQGNWEIHLLCDGHDKAGHMVALGVCQQLPKILLRKITERSNDKTTSCGENDPVSDKLVNEAFDECARVVCWTREGITVGIWVKVFEGQWADKPGYIKEANVQGRVRVAIIDENGYHLPSIDRNLLRKPRYTGGCTCLCLIRNTKTKECKIAVSGDSRLLVLPTMGVNDAVLLRQFGLEETEANAETDKPPPQGLITPAHNVYNEDERERLERDFHGQYEFDGNFLVNPITKFAIQPTRGFGDFDMFGTGYTHRPEITKTFTLEPNGLIFSASDGVFDSHVWSDEEIVSCLDKYIEDGLTSAQIVDHMYTETLQRSLEGGYVDDISIFCYREPAPEGTNEGAANSVQPVKKDADEDIVNDAMDLPTPTKVRKKKNTKEQRRTIGRGENSYTNLSAKVLELKEKMIKEDPTAFDGKASSQQAEGTAEVEKLEDILNEDDNDILDGVEHVMRNLAASHKLENGIDPKELLTGNSFSESKDDADDNADPVAEEPNPSTENDEGEGDDKTGEKDEEEDLSKF